MVNKDIRKQMENYENHIPIWQQIGMGLVGFLLMWLMCFL